MAGVDDLVGAVLVHALGGSVRLRLDEDRLAGRLVDLGRYRGLVARGSCSLRSGSGGLPGSLFLGNARLGLIGSRLHLGKRLSSLVLGLLGLSKQAL